MDTQIPRKLYSAVLISSPPHKPSIATATTMPKPKKNSKNSKKSPSQRVQAQGTQSLINTSVKQKAKDSKIVNEIMETYGSPYYHNPPPPPASQLSYAQVAPPPPSQLTYAQVVQPRARRSSTIHAVTNWPEPPPDHFQVQSPSWHHPYDRGMSNYPGMSLHSEEILDNPSRQSSPFPHLPYVVDAKTLRDAVNKDAGQIFESIVAIMEELNRVRGENENLRSDNITLRNDNVNLRGENENLWKDNQNLKENWQDVSHQVQEQFKELSSTQAELGETQGRLNFAWEDINQLRQEWISRSQRYEELIGIGSAKQVVLWKHIEKIENGQRSMDKGDWAAVPPLTGTCLTPTAFDSEGSDSTITESKGSPERKSRARTRKGVSRKTGLESEMSKAGGRGRGSSSERAVFNPAANSFVPGGGSPTNSIISTTSRPEAPQHVDLLSCILSLPPRFFGICPNSLCASSEYRCTIPTCRLQHVCEAYNDEKGQGCKDPSCKFVHEYRSCHEEIDGYGCRFVGVSKDSNSKMKHLERKAHKQYVSDEEWRARCIVAGLRAAHLDGKY